MNLQSMSDQSLLLSIEKLVRQERELLTAVLHHLREIERRRLFADLGFSSLFDYATKELAYSADQAARRIAAMRLIKDLPEVEEKLRSGALSLTNAAMAQNHFRRDKKTSSADKRALLGKLENKSTREAEREIAALAPEPHAKPDSAKPISAETTEFRFSGPAHLEEKIAKLKGLLAHSNPGITMAELLEKLLDLGLQEWDPGRPANRERAPSRNKQGRLGAPQVAVSRPDRREVWQRAGSRCGNCGGQYALQIDHARPRAQGGTSELGNLRLLCRSCNQRAAIKKLGVEKMDPHINSQGRPRGT